MPPTKGTPGATGKKIGRVLFGLTMGGLWLLAMIGPACLLKGQTAGKFTSAGAPAVKVAAMMKILPYIQWPTNSFASSNSTFVFVVLDAPEVAAQIQKMAAAEQKVGDHPIQVRRQLPDSLKDVRLVYLGRDSRKGIGGLPESVRKSPILLVGEQPGFAQSGGVVNLLFTEEVSQIELSREAASRVGIRFSSQLASLKRIQWIDEPTKP